MENGLKDPNTSTDGADLLQQAKNTLVAHLYKLFEDAKTIQQRHIDLVNAEGKKYEGWDGRNALCLRCHMTGNSLVLDWITVSWKRYPGQEKSSLQRHHIVRGKGNFTYPMKTLLSKAKEWEAPIVEHTETALGELRQEAHHVVKSLVSLYNVDRARKAHAQRNAKQSGGK